MEKTAGAFPDEQPLGRCSFCKQEGTKSRSSTVITERLFRVAESLDHSLLAVYLSGERKCPGGHVIARKSDPEDGLKIGGGYLPVGL